MKHTALPWHWWIEDHSMATLSGQDELRDHVMSVSPCKNCIVEGESPFGKCTMPSEADAAFIVQACNSHDDLVAACKAAIAYDNAIRNSANDPEKMASFCTAQGDDLDSLYESWISLSRAALKRAKWEA